MGGAFAAGGGSFVGGINPLNDADWVTMGNFMAYTNTLHDIGITIKSDVVEPLQEMNRES